MSNARALSKVKIVLVPGFAQAEDIYRVEINGVAVGWGDTEENAVADIARRAQRASQTRDAVRRLAEQLLEKTDF